MSKRSSARGTRPPGKRTDVGYGRPPKEHRFKPGESGNRRGRPKGSKTEEAIIDELLNRKLKVRDSGKTRSITLLEGIFSKFAEAALQGNAKAATFLLNRKRLAGSSEQPATVELDSDDRDILKFYTQQLHEQFKRQEKKN